MKNLILLVLLFMVSLVAFPPCSEAKIVGIVFGIKGKVLYSTDQENWKTIPPLKRIRDMVYVKTGPTGSCKIKLNNSKEIKLLTGNSILKITDKKVELIQGELLDNDSESGLMQAVKRKMRQSQSYTAVRIDDPSSDVPGDILILEDEIIASEEQDQPSTEE